MSRLLSERRVACGTVLGLFGLSCALPACYGEGGFLESGVVAYGCDLLAIGWFFGPWLAWLANPLLALALVCVWKRQEGVAAVSAGVGTGLSLTPLYSLGGFRVPDFRLEPPIAIVFHDCVRELRLGYFLWVVSHVVLFVWSVSLWYLTARRSTMKTVPMQVVLLAIGVISGLTNLDVLCAAEPWSNAVPRWEYRFLTKDQVMDLGKKDLAVGLNLLGDEGWELVAVEPAYYFKRQKGQSPRQAEDVKQRILLAKSEIEMWKDRVAWSERMVRKGYMTEHQLQGERALLKAAELVLEQAEKERKVSLPEPKAVPEKERDPEK
jgi:hypothetical protein